jgi:outer membrane protein assembly factor BamD
MLAGCSGSDDSVENIAEKNESIDVLYDKALETFQKKSYKAATEAFEEVERQHPYSEWASHAQIMAAYSAYKGGQLDDAVVILDRFVKLHPTHPSAPYAYYLTALSYYTQISDVGRDQKMSERARAALKDVVERFPDSDYARDAKVKLELTEDHLAGKEMEIGRYYLKRKNYAAAINRFRAVVSDFQTTTQTAEALHRLVESYLSLGLTDEAQTAAAILGYNYQASPFYQDSFDLLKKQGLAPKARGDNWLAAIYRQTVKGEWL